MYFWVGGKWFIYVSWSWSYFNFSYEEADYDFLSSFFTVSIWRMTLRFSVNLIFLYFDSNSSASFFFLASFFSSNSCYFFAWRISSGKPSRSNNLSISLICFLVVAFLFFCLNVAFRWNWPRFNLFLFDSLSWTLPTRRAFLASSASFYYSYWNCIASSSESNETSESR